MLPTNPLLNATAPAGPHLPTATLRQYAAGTLAPAARHRVEAHTLACPRCADVLEGLLQTPAATTDQALAQLQQRLRRRVQQAPTALPATRNRWLVPQLAAAATLLFGLLAGGWWTWQQRHAAPATTAQPTTVARATGPATPSQTIASAASIAIVQAADSLDRRPVVRANQASARRLKPRTKKHAVLTATRKCNCDTQAPDLTNNTSLVESAVAELTKAIGKQPTTPALTNSPAAPIGTAPTADSVPAVSSLVTTDHVSSPDTARSPLSGRAAGVAIAAPAARTPAAASALVHDQRMPAAPPVPPMPAPGYPAWREKIRLEAAEFEPEEKPLSGSVQLRVTIGADGKVQEIRVLHGLRADYDAEAQRLVCDGPGWVPGIGGGKRAAQAVDIAVPF